VKEHTCVFVQQVTALCAPHNQHVS